MNRWDSLLLARLPGIAIIAAAACSDTTASGPRTYTVSYRLTGTSSVSFDSVRYEDAQGMVVKVAAPSPGWVVAFSAGAGCYVQAAAWGHASAGGQTATLKVMWTESGVSTASDSSTAVISAPSAFALDVARRQL